MASKIIVTGSLNGQYPAVLKKLANLHAKNSFALGIILGDFFADPSTATEADDENITSLLSNNFSIPFPLYFTLGRHPLPERAIQKLTSDGGELCENLHFLGKRTALTSSEKIRLVALGGQLDSNIIAGISKDNFTPFHTADDAKALRGANTADLLLTSSWPQSIRLGSKVALPPGTEEPTGQQFIADLCAALKPRYHFSVSPDLFFEREPFFHAPTADNPDRPITRFISLAAYRNSLKQKWLYAFSLDPSASTSAIIPAGTTASPLSSSSKKRAANADSQSFSRFSNDSSHGHRPSKRSRQPPPGPGECFFCLSNPNLATHLIASIASDSYLTTAKGPLSTSKTYPSLSFPSHILIIPLAHSPTLASIPEAEVRASTFSEMTRYRQALQSMLKSQGSGRLGAVTWEVSRTGGVHDHWQFLPIGRELVDKGLAEAAFKVEAENDKYPKFETRALEEGEDERGDFFRIWIWAPALEDRDGPTQSADEQGKNEKSLVLPLSHEFRFDLQFGRRVLAKLLGLEDRINWKDCLQDEGDEKRDVEAFKTAFKAFDFSADE